MNQNIDLRVSKKSAKAGDSIPHESAHLHVTGQATYIDDLPELENTLHLAVGFSNCAKGKISKFDLEAVRQADGVHAVFRQRILKLKIIGDPLLKMTQFLLKSRLSFMDKPCLWLLLTLISKPVRQFA